MPTPPRVLRLPLALLLLLTFAAAVLLPASPHGFALADDNAAAADPYDDDFGNDSSDPDDPDTDESELLFSYTGGDLSDSDQRIFPVQPDDDPDLPFRIDELAPVNAGHGGPDPLGYIWHVRNAKTDPTYSNTVFSFAGYAVTLAPHLDILVQGNRRGTFNLDATMYTVEPDEVTPLRTRLAKKGKTRVIIADGDPPLNTGDLGFITVTANPSVIAIGDGTTLTAQLLTPDRALDPADGVDLSVVTPLALGPTPSVLGSASYPYTPATAGLKPLAGSAPDYTPDAPEALAVVAVECFTADRGVYVPPDTPDGPAYQYVTIDPAYPTVTITACPNITLSDSKLPASWTLRKGETGPVVPHSGGHPDDTRQKITIDALTPGEHLVIAECGTSVKNICIVIEPVTAVVTEVDYDAIDEDAIHIVSKDEDATPYPTVEWTTETAEDENPVAYVRGSTAELTAKIEINLDAAPDQLTVRGTGPEGIVFEGELGAEEGGTVTFAGGVATMIDEASAAFKNEVDHFDTFDITWEVSLNGGTTWISAGTTANRVYVLLDDPRDTTLFHTLAHFTTEAAEGKDTQKDVFVRIWNGVRGRDIERVNGTTLNYNHDGGQECYDTAAMLADDTGRGRCGAFAFFLVDALAIHGISAVHLTVTVGIDAPPPPALGYILDRSAIVVRDLPAQGTGGDNYGRQIFNDHSVVTVDIAEYSSALFDPSYGLSMFSSDGTLADAQRKWEDQNLQAYGWIYIKEGEENMTENRIPDPAIVELDFSEVIE